MIHSDSHTGGNLELYFFFFDGMISLIWRNGGNKWWYTWVQVWKVYLFYIVLSLYSLMKDIRELLTWYWTILSTDDVMILATCCRFTLRNAQTSKCSNNALLSTMISATTHNTTRGKRTESDRRYVMLPQYLPESAVQVFTVQQISTNHQVPKH